MRVCISGSHSSGKTTLIQSLKLTEEFRDFKFIESPTRKVKELFGVEINNHSKDYTPTQLACLSYDLHTLANTTGDVLQDRGILDSYIYSKYLYLMSKIPISTYRFIKEAYLRNIEKYDLTIVTSIKGVKLDLTDNFRVDDTSFREDIDTLFIRELHRLERHRIVRQTLFIEGDNEARVQLIKETIKRHEEENRGLC